MDTDHKRPNVPHPWVPAFAGMTAKEKEPEYSWVRSLTPPP